MKDLILVGIVALWFWLGYRVGQKRERRESVDRCRETFAAGVEVGVWLSSSRGAPATRHDFMTELSDEIERVRKS